MANTIATSIAAARGSYVAKYIFRRNDWFHGCLYLSVFSFIIRNRLLYVNTLVRVFSLYIATASLVGSLFGMNLKNNLENEEDVFLQVVWGTIVGCLALLVLLIIFITKSGVAPKPRMQLLADSAESSTSYSY